MRRIYAVITCEIKLIENNYFSLRRRPTEIISFQRVETRLNYFKIVSEAYCSS